MEPNGRMHWPKQGDLNCQVSCVAREGFQVERILVTVVLLKTYIVPTA